MSETASKSRQGRLRVLGRASRAVRGAASAIGVALVLAGLWGCSDSRTVLTESQLEEKRATDNAEVAGMFSAAIDRMVERIARENDEFAAGKTPNPARLDVLALSGGGDFGAFGAGFLVGWGETPEKSDRRPDFDVVTGVSTGALIAPFAYLGTDASNKRVQEFYRNPQPDWVKERGPLFFMPFQLSFMEIPGLERDINGIVDKEFVADLAEQSKTGKLLAISATNLDLGSQRFWEVGVEAQRAQVSGNSERLSKIMRASAAIPAVFPPVEIEGFLYADGGVTANVFLRLDPDSPGGFLQSWKRKYPGRPIPKIRFWIIVNNQMHPPPKTVPLNWPAIIGPSLGTSIRSATIAEIRWLAAQTDYVNTAFGTDIEVMVTAIPDAWRAPVEGDFQKATMESLTDLGRKMGADPKSWQVWAKPRK